MIGKSVRLAMLVCAGSCMIGLAMAQDPSDLLFRQRIAEAWAASSDHRPAVADRLLDAVIVDARFESLPVNDQVPLLSRAAFAAWQNNRLDVASDRYARIGQLGSDDPDDWYRMALVSYARSDFDAAARAMAIFIGRWPELLPNLDADVLFSLMFNGDTASQDRIAYYQALFDSNWDGGSAGTLGAAWFRLARTRLNKAMSMAHASSHDASRSPKCCCRCGQTVGSMPCSTMPVGAPTSPTPLNARSTACAVEPSPTPIARRDGTTGLRTPACWQARGCHRAVRRHCRPDRSRWTG